MSIVRIADFTVRISTINAVQLAAGEPGLVLHHNGTVTVVPADDEQQAREWLNAITKLLNEEPLTNAPSKAIID